ncbi:TPA: XRE family transcriptional regulator [Mannheimia haemolytica]
MNSLAFRMKSVMQSKGISQSLLAEKIGSSQQAIALILSEQISSPKKIVEIADALDVDVNWLKTGKGKAPDFANFEGNSTVSGVEVAQMLRVEVLDVYASAGNGSFVTGDLTAYTHAVEFENAYFAQVFQRANAKGLSIINVDGDSMEPTIGNGDLLFVDTTKSAYQGDGVYVFSYGENLYVKRLQFAGDELLVISDNPLYKEWRITSENEHKFQIHGKVEFMQGHIRRV